MMAALGVLTLLTLTFPIVDPSLAFLAVYMMLFAILLFAYEFMWWTPIAWLNKMLRKNFGFMYGLGGKGAYLIFVAFLCLGLGNDGLVKILTWATGISYLVFGTVHVLIPLMNPTLALKYQAPTAGLLAKEYSSGVSNPV
jgi:COPI associated protein